MKQILSLVFIFFFGLTAAASPENNSKRTFRLQPNLTAADYVPGKIIFKIKSDYRNACSKSSIKISSLEKLTSTLQAEYIEKKFPRHSPPSQHRNSTGQELSDISLIYELKYNAGLPIEKAINILLQDASVAYAEPEYVVQLLYTPNDTAVAKQYQLFAIKAFEGWDIAKGDTNIVIGITDTGSDMDHPDLVNQVKYNYADPINGIDDDGDGYTDNFMGWDLGDNDNDPTCANSLVHGSFVAGCASAQADNVTGIAGSGFFCKYLPVKISAGNILTKAYEGIVYAADHGCQIINCSWGGFSGGQAGQDIINYAAINKNCLIIGAAGNSNNEEPFFPASYKNVLSVTGTNDRDEKWAGSSYGINVDMSAPGQAVYSTIFDNNWSISYGTSFSAPIVAGCAGIVMAFRDTLTPLQVAEQLRATSDDVDTIIANLPYRQKLGKGRMNLFRALTENARSVRMSDINSSDNNDEAFTAGDTLSISGIITNWLEPVSNLTITLTANSADVTILNNLVTIPSMAMLAVTDNNGNPFKVKISPSIPFNTKVMFTLNYADASGYTDFQSFELILNVDYINVRANDIGTSITSTGRIGYNRPNQMQGIGFTYKESESVLFESCFLAGVSENAVSDHMFDAPVSVNNHDFVPEEFVRAIVPPAVSELDLYSTFNDDSANFARLNLLTTQRTFAWSTLGDEKYIILLYTLLNQGSSPMDSLYAGIFCDWDITDAAKNRAAVDYSTKTGYAWQPGGIYAGVKVLGNSLFNCYAFDNDGANGSLTIYDGFPKFEKYISMSTPRDDAGISGAGNDVSAMVASGPYSLNAGDSLQIGFALMADDSLQGLLNSANAAETKFELITALSENKSTPSSFHNFPNPFIESTNISFSLSSPALVELNIYDLAGQEVASVVNKKLPQGKHHFKTGNNLRSGIYFATLTIDDKKETVKVVKIN